MPIHNSDIITIFETVADMLEIKGENQFRIRAYRNAARVVQGLSRNVADMIEQGEDLSKLSGVGKDLAGKMKEIVETGTLGQLEQLKKQLPAGTTKMMEIAGLGGKRVAQLYHTLDIKNLDELKRAATEGRIAELPGFGQKTSEKILEGIERLQKSRERQLWSEAEEIVAPYVDYLRKSRKVKEVIIAGSFRRRREMVGDIDILATCSRGSNLMDRFVKYSEIQKVVSHGDTRSTVLLRGGLQVDLRVVQQNSYGAALHYFTGSKAHNIAIRKMGVRRKLKINEYGIFKNEKRVGGATEEDVYASVNLPYIPPELREDRGEIDAAREGKLPKLITLDDIRGELHAHTKNTDGRNTAEEMAEAARKLGYSYLAITDHTQQIRVARGMDAARMRKAIEQIDQLNDKRRGFAVLKGAEVDILENGSLDLPDEVLKELDITICSVHSKFGLPRKQQTERIIRAMDNRYFSVLGHPSGRLINQRPPYQITIEAVLQAAAQRGCFVELNGQPERMDLSDTDARMARDMGVMVVLNTDAHGTGELENMRHAVGQARRAWLRREDVLNTRSASEIRKLLNKRR